MGKKINLNERIFVAGGTGMVGSAIIRYLKKKSYGNKSQGGEILAPTSKELNLVDTEAVKSWFQVNQPTVTILAAGKVGGIIDNSSRPTEFILNNLKIQTNVIEASWLSGVKRFLFLGSSCIYPKFASQPICEENLLTGELEKTNEWYAIAKITGIKLCQALRKEHNFDTLSLMPTNLYGPNDNYHPTRSHVMAAFLKRFKHAAFYNLDSIDCWGTGLPLREFLHVDDLASAVVFCLEHWDPESESAPKDKNGEKLNYLNVGFGKDISIKDLAELIADLTGYKGKINWDKTKPDGTPKKLLNIEKIKNLGWYPKIDLKEGILRTLEEISL